MVSLAHGCNLMGDKAVDGPISDDFGAIPPSFFKPPECLRDVEIYTTCTSTSSSSRAASALTLRIVTRQ